MPYFEDVEPGETIGPLETVASDEGVISFCQVWRDSSMPDRFTDQAIAEKSNLPGPIVPGIMSMGIMARLLTDWAGPDGLKDLDLVFRQPVPHNKTLTITATITDTRREAGENLVACDILMTGTQGERYIGGTATVALPSKR